VDVPLSTSTALATRDELFSANEQLALAGFLAGYSGLTRDADTLDLRQYVACAPNTGWRCSVPVAPTSSASPATSSPWAGPGPPSPAGLHRGLLLPPNRKV
jgi:hypothetical protein